jgi:hypothetical protein
MPNRNLPEAETEVMTMAETRETETFALGLIVAALLYLIFRREFARRGTGEKGTAGAAGASGAGATGSCGCGGGVKTNTNASVTPIGGNSYGSPEGAYPRSPILPSVNLIGS